MEHITLNFRQNSSDKVSQANIEPKQGGSLVTFAPGRRGTTSKAQVKYKVAEPVEEAV